MPPSVASVGWARWIPSVCRPGQGCLPRASQLARDVLSPSALQAVPPGQRGRVLGDVEGVVSLPGLRCVASVVQTKLLVFTSHRIIIERDPRENSRDDISIFRMI